MEVLYDHLVTLEQVFNHFLTQYSPCFHLLAEADVGPNFYATFCRRSLSFVSYSKWLKCDIFCWQDQNVATFFLLPMKNVALTRDYQTAYMGNSSRELPYRPAHMGVAPPIWEFTRKLARHSLTTHYTLSQRCLILLSIRSIAINLCHCPDVHITLLSIVGGILL